MKPHRQDLLALRLGLPLVLALACAQLTPGATPTPPPTGTLAPGPTTTRVVPATVAPAPTPVPTPLPRPLIWFGPNSRGDPSQPVPLPDLEDFYDPAQSWGLAPGAVVHIYQFYPQNFTEGIVPLANAVAKLNADHIAIATEFGGLRDWQCSGAIMAQVELDTLRPLLEAGGELNYIGLDSPFAHTLATGFPNPCQYDLPTAAAELLIYVTDMRAALPNVRFGLIEPVPWYHVGDDYPSHPGLDIGDLLEVLQTAFDVLDAGGQPLDFYRADSPFDYTEALPGSQGWQKLVAIQDFVQARGKRFGIIFNSERGGHTSDELFFRETVQARVNFALAGGDPDDIILQSWYAYPTEWLPADEPYTWMYLVNYMLTARETRLTLAADTPDSIAGTLLTRDGAPVAGAAVTLAATPLDGPGIRAEYTVTGTVPAGATEATVGLRVNEECGSPVAMDLAWYGTRYFENGGDVNFVPNSRFANGLEQWGYTGNTTVSVLPSDQGSGFMLAVSAAAGQSLNLNSGSFPATAGAAYAVTFEARIAPVSEGSGCFAVFFLSGAGEVERQPIALEATAVHLGAAITDAAGLFQLGGLTLPPGRLRLAAAYAGDEVYFPTHVQTETAPAP